MMVPATSNQLSQADFTTIRELVHSVCGINLHTGKEVLVRTRLARRIHALGLSGYAEYVRYLRQDRSGEEVAHMVDVLTTNKTSFFREPQHFDFMRRHVMPRWVEARRPIRIWSAGCSSGEEPYTISMVLHEAIPDLAQRDLKILATDISERVLERARQGEYTAEVLAQLPTGLERRYFTREGNGGRVTGALRAPIRFARLNLMERWPMRGRFDLIFCRNVMIYFDAATQQRLVQRFEEILKPGGYLFVGHSESLTALDHQLQYIQPAVYSK